MPRQRPKVEAAEAAAPGHHIDSNLTLYSDSTDSEISPSLHGGATDMIMIMMPHCGPGPGQPRRPPAPARAMTSTAALMIQVPRARPMPSGRAEPRATVPLALWHRRFVEHIRPPSESGAVDRQPRELT